MLILREPTGQPVTYPDGCFSQCKRFDIWLFIAPVALPNHGTHLVPEELQHLVHLIHPKLRLALLQLGKKPQDQSGLFRQLALKCNAYF